MSVELEFTVDGTHLVRTDDEKITNKTRNYIDLVFTSFSEDWDDLDIYLILQDEAKQNYLFDLNESTPTVTVPEIVLRGGFFKLSVFGFNDDERITTNTRTIYLQPSGYTTSHIRPVEQGDYSKDIFEDWTERLDNQVETDMNDFLIALTEGIRS